MSNVASKLGLPPSARIAVLHVDDVGMCHGANTAFLELYRKGAGRWRANGSLRAATAIWGNEGHGTITEPETTRQALRVGRSRTTTNGKKIEVTGCDVFTFQGRERNSYLKNRMAHTSRTEWLSSQVITHPPEFDVSEWTLKSNLHRCDVLFGELGAAAATFVKERFGCRPCND